MTPRLFLQIQGLSKQKNMGGTLRPNDPPKSLGPWTISIPWTDIKQSADLCVLCIRPKNIRSVQFRLLRIIFRPSFKGHPHQRFIAATMRFIAWNRAKNASYSQKLPWFPNQTSESLSCFKLISDVYLIKCICKHCSTTYIVDVWEKKKQDSAQYAAGLVPLWYQTEFRLVPNIIGEVSLQSKFGFFQILPDSVLIEMNDVNNVI